jgi:hypothetical protein
MFPALNSVDFRIPLEKYGKSRSGDDIFKLRFQRIFSFTIFRGFRSIFGSNRDLKDTQPTSRDQRIE